MFKKLRVLILSLILILPIKNTFAKDIPVIVIGPSKKAQSISTVGTSVTVLDSSFFENSNELFLGNALTDGTTSSNFFQTGGQGSTSAIQLRGLPKRYSTVYIDGVKMSDPASVSNDYDFNHILTGQVERVEILKGNQSSVYGSGAIGGTINITTKKGKPGFHKNLQYNNGSYGTNDISLSFSGADENDNFYVGLERFQTDGMSAMTHNNEKDRYRNNTLVANYAHEFTDKIEFKSNLRIAETYTQYDKETNTSTADHSEEIDAVQSSSNIALVYKPNNQFTNKISLANTYIERIAAATVSSGNANQDNYYGNRNAITYQGNYNLNLDNSIVFGLEREDDQMGFNKDMTGRINKAVHMTSSYFDFQSRVTNNIYATFGSRFDEHSISGNEDSHRATIAYLFDDKTTKLKSSYGTGFRYPSLYETFYQDSGAHSYTLQAENSESFDFGVEKSFLDLGLNIDASYFNLKYYDTLEAWNSSSWLARNLPGTVKSQGLELIAKWKKNQKLDFDLNYTYTSSYDGAEQDDPNKNEAYFDARLVRVPRHIVNLSTNFKIPGYEDLDFTLKTKWSDNSRDYGNGNRTYQDETLDDYLVNDLSVKYNLFDTYKIFFNVNNIFDEKYETARDYSQMDRSYNFGIRRSY